MSKTSATLSIVGAFVVVGFVSYLGGTKQCPPAPSPNDGNPIGFRVNSKVLAIIPSGSPPAATALQNCSKAQSCSVQIEFSMPSASGAASPVPSTCPKPEQCYQFTGQVQLSSTNWNSTPHPASGYPPEQRYAAGTIYISDK